MTKTERDVNRGGRIAVMLAFALCCGPLPSAAYWQYVVIGNAQRECRAVLTLRKSWQELELHERKGPISGGAINLSELISPTIQLRGLTGKQNMES